MKNTPFQGSDPAKPRICLGIGIRGKVTAKAAPLLSVLHPPGPASRAAQTGPAGWCQGLWVWGAAAETGLLWGQLAVSPGAFLLLGGRRSGGFLQKPTSEWGSGAQMSRTPTSRKLLLKTVTFLILLCFLAGLLFLTLFSTSPLLTFSWSPPKQGLSLLLLSPLSQPPPPGGPVPLVPPEQHSPFRYHLLLPLLGPGFVWGLIVLGDKCMELILQELLPRLGAAPLPGVQDFP